MKKGYMFTVDAILAILILSGSIVFILAHLTRPQTDYYIDRMPSDLIGVLSYTQTSDICNLGGAASECSCNPKYPITQQLVCSPLIRNRDVSMLELYSEVIYANVGGTSLVEDSIHEIFVTNNVMDERRFGFSILYTTPTSSAPLEIYNTETYTP